MRLLKIVTLCVIVSCLAAPLSAQSQGNNCRSFHGILQATLDVTPGTGLGWSGIVRGFLDNNIPLIGYLTGGQEADTIAHGQTGHEPGTWFAIDFGTKGILVTVPDKGIFPVSPQVAPHMSYPPEYMLGSYYSTPKVAPNAGSSGWFKDATGNLTFNGTFLVDNASIFADGTLKNIGAWNSEINGKLCNVKP
jgi:hypothetical protein